MDAGREDFGVAYPDRVAGVFMLGVCTLDGALEEALISIGAEGGGGGGGLAPLLLGLI